MFLTSQRSIPPTFLFCWNPPPPPCTVFILSEQTKKSSRRFYIVLLWLLVAPELHRPSNVSASWRCFHQPLFSCKRLNAYAMTDSLWTSATVHTNWGFHTFLKQNAWFSRLESWIKVKYVNVSRWKVVLSCLFLDLL